MQTAQALCCHKSGIRYLHVNEFIQSYQNINFYMTCWYRRSKVTRSWKISQIIVSSPKSTFGKPNSFGSLWILKQLEKKWRKLQKSAMQQEKYFMTDLHSHERSLRSFILYSKVHTVLFYRIFYRILFHAAWLSIQLNQFWICVSKVWLKHEITVFHHRIIRTRV